MRLYRSSVLKCKRETQKCINRCCCAPTYRSTHPPAHPSIHPPIYRSTPDPPTDPPTHLVESRDRHQPVDRVQHIATVLVVVIGVLDVSRRNLLKKLCGGIWRKADFRKHEMVETDGGRVSIQSATHLEKPALALEIRRRNYTLRTCM